MPLTRDIVDKIKEQFSANDAPKAIELLQAAGKSDRIARCIIFAAAGNLEGVRRHIELAEEDYRDVICAGEYDEMHRRLRDFSVSFLIDAPVKMWISLVAVALARRGHFLSSLETKSVNGGDLTYLSDLGEGTATFNGDLGEIRVVKEQGQWILNGDAAELALYDLAEPFQDETKFGDAISCYILAKRTTKSTTSSINSG